MDLKKMALGLTAAASLFAGCADEGASTTATSTTNTNTTSTTLPPIPDSEPCVATNPFRYRLDTVVIPTLDHANASEQVGHNVDGIGTSCEVQDFPGGVDNAFLELNGALPSLSSDINLQAEIDDALSCAEADPTCTRLDLFVTVATGPCGVEVSVADADGVTLAGPFLGILDANGNMDARVANLDLSIPFGVDGGPAYIIELSLTNVIFTGNRTDTELTNIIIGGALAKDGLEATLMGLLDNTSLGESVTFEQLESVLSTLYDVEINGDCAALSVGLLASGAVVPAT